eukprot:gene10933-biopygen6323
MIRSGGGWSGRCIPLGVLELIPFSGCGLVGNTVAQNHPPHQLRRGALPFSSGPRGTGSDTHRKKRKQRRTGGGPLDRIQNKRTWTGHRYSRFSQLRPTLSTTRSISTVCSLNGSEGCKSGTGWRRGLGLFWSLSGESVF